MQFLIDALLFIGANILFVGAFVLYFVITNLIGKVIK